MKTFCCLVLDNAEGGGSAMAPAAHRYLAQDAADPSIVLEQRGELKRFYCFRNKVIF